MNVHVLLIEDNADHLVLAQRSCDQSHFVLTLASSLAEARRLLAEQTFDLIVSDLILPDGRGDELLTTADDDLPLPVVLVTGQGDEQIAVAALKAGALDYIVKTPASVRDLPRIIERALRERRLLVEHRQAEQALRQSERLFRAMIERSSDAISIVDRAGLVRYASPSTRHLIGYAVDGMLAVPINGFAVIHPIDRERVRQLFNKLIQHPGSSVTADFRVRHAEGGWRWIEATASNWLDDPAVQGVIVNYRDITERKMMELRLQHGILHDTLTGLPNRLLLNDRLWQAIKRSHRNLHYQFALLFLDLDHFKFINDSFGHPVGDRLLIAIASRLRSCLRAVDTCARLGGDEFVILLDDIASPTDAIRIVERILRQVSLPFEIDGRLFHTAASIGIVFGANNYTDPSQMLRDADIAMYQAKMAGKGRYRIFEPAMREAAQIRLALEHELRRAVANHEFCVYYQPIIHLTTGRLVGFEALVRWRHPTRGILLPAAFLHVAEEAGLNDSIGWQVLEQVCQQLVVWRRLNPRAAALSVSVNLSARQFMQPDLYDRLIQLLEQYQVPSTALKLELTESALMEYNHDAVALLTRLREQGIQIAIDDFGVGYSSLSYLVQLPIDQVKIDRNFIFQLESKHHSQAIVNTIVNLAHNLNLEVVAEGVETQGQLDRIRAIGCQYGQGYLMGLPLTADEATQMVQKMELPED
ncbi:putative bifunctional diguanylate cyclase/phosphodiesterase [Chloroflexus sp.]|uniref:putative bifunctional diguanylate cyclase/phosphodiesterase n=1 Tax=Chloroflexus sp. TaxID=1904827 RepID=UPI003D132363